MLPPPHSLHWLLMRLCWQMPSPPQSLHWFLIRLCWQMPAPDYAYTAASKIGIKQMLSQRVGGLKRSGD